MCCWALELYQRWYLLHQVHRSIERIPNTVLQHFLNGEHVVRPQDGLCNAVWSDNATESTYMENGKGPSGLIDQTIQERTVKIWSNSHHLCGEIAKELENLRTKKMNKPKIHKEETVGRMKSDADDRKKIREGLLTFIHPLKIETHSETFLSISTMGKNLVMMLMSQNP